MKRWNCTPSRSGHSTVLFVFLYSQPFFYSTFILIVIASDLKKAHNCSMELDHTADQLYLYDCEVHLVQLKKITVFSFVRAVLAIQIQLALDSCSYVTFERHIFEMKSYSKASWTDRPSWG